MNADTIYALASGGAGSALSVMRISGAGSGGVLDGLCRRPPPRHAALRRLRHRGEVLDQALVLWMPGPGTYTGEDVAELHLHGGGAVAEVVADALAARGARPAEPGEFTRRAFLNGRMDLTAAEGIADLVAAETEGQRRQALRQMEGALGRVYDDWAARLRRLLAAEEAAIDFPESDDVAEAEPGWGGRVEAEALGREIASHLADGRRGERLREGLCFAIVGPPNVGKSSLLNALAGREVAIVAPTPGTTRDPVETRVALAGVPVTLVDTAGLRDARDPIEAEGMRRARARAEAADLVIELVPCEGAADASPVDAATMRVLGKSDLGIPEHWSGPAVSALTGDGLDALRAGLAREAQRLAGADHAPALTRSRHRAALSEAGAALSAACDDRPSELRAEELRLALRAIGRITGRVDVEALLDTIFSGFCVGK